MSHDTCYYWVVICKNHRFHNRQNQLFGHKILLAETDEYSPMPVLDGRFTVRCDDCGQEYAYKPKDVRRLESDYLDDLRPHPLFVSDFPSLSVPGSTSAQEASSPAPETVSAPLDTVSVPPPEQRLNTFLEAFSRDLREGSRRVRTTLALCVQRARNMLPTR
jgi:hypothetical protein